MDSKDTIRKNLEQAREILEQFASEGQNMEAIARAAQLMAEALRGGGQVIACGNGGSLCDATHFAEELTARFRGNRRALRAVAINDAAFITCVGNDFGFEQCFSRYVEAYGSKGDVLLAISTSGGSPNVVNAARMASSLGMKVVGLTGKGGGELAGMCDVEIRAPRSQYSDRPQEIHIKVIHTLVQIIEAELGVDKQEQKVEK